MEDSTSLFRGTVLQLVGTHSVGMEALISASMLTVLTVSIV